MMERTSGVAVISKTYIPGLNGMRAGAVLMVMVGHAGFATIVPGGLGVTVFFFISGFLITSLLLQEHRASGSISIGSFYFRRFLRLGPELLGYLACSSLLGLLYVGADGRLPGALDWVGALAYVTNYVHLLFYAGGDGLRWPHLWSLAVEEHFYLTFPLFFAYACRRPAVAFGVLIGVCLGGLAWRCMILALGFPDNWFYEASDARFDSIAYGCLTACLFAWKPERFAMPRRMRSTALVLGFCLMISSLLLRNEDYRETLRFTLQGVAMMMLVTGLYISRPGHYLIRLLELAPIRWMGVLSYGAYLWHFDVIVAASHFSGVSPEDWPLGARLTFAASCAIVSFALAFLSYRMLYVPFVSLRRRFGSRSRNEPGLPMPLTAANLSTVGQAPSETGGRSFGTTESRLDQHRSM